MTVTKNKIKKEHDFVKNETSMQSVTADGMIEMWKTEKIYIL